MDIEINNIIITRFDSKLLYTIWILFFEHK